MPYPSLNKLSSFYDHISLNNILVIDSHGLIIIMYIAASAVSFYLEPIVGVSMFVASSLIIYLAQHLDISRVLPFMMASLVYLVVCKFEAFCVIFVHALFYGMILSLQMNHWPQETIEL
ncbi:unnamed protein product [Lymnaea stagnalis]|uniref:Uncharacterized protein n=1 Tax=Lymnaea stagnalis TaxID=6523 RepID=A0AAV2HWA8_LYMST